MTHREIVELLPFYVNGTLAPHERDLVDAEVGACASCARELGAARALRTVIRDDAAPAADVLWERTQARLDGPADRTGRRRWLTAAAWSGLLTLPAQFALAATLVILGGAAGAGLVRATTPGAPSLPAGSTTLIHAGAPRSNVLRLRGVHAVLRVANLSAALMAVDRIVLHSAGLDANVMVQRAASGTTAARAVFDGSPGGIDHVIAALSRIGALSLLASPADAPVSHLDVDIDVPSGPGHR